MTTLQIPDATQVSSFAASLNSLAQDQSKVLLYYFAYLMEIFYLYIIFVLYLQDVDDAIRILNDLLSYPMTLDILQVNALISIFCYLIYDSTNIFNKLMIVN